MNNKEFLRRMFSTDRMNLRYFLKLYFCKEAQISIGKSEKIVMKSRKRKAFNVLITIKNEEIDCYVVLNKKLNGFILFVPEKERAIQFTVRDKVNIEKENHPIEKRAKVEYFIKDTSGKFFRGTLGSYLKEGQEWAWCN